VTVQHCIELKNILVITEPIIATLFDQVLIVRHLMLLRAFVLTRLTSSQKPFHVTQMAYFKYTDTSDQSSSIIAMISVTREVRNLGVPTQRPRDILQQAKGIILIESTETRWFSR
jgi:hypothetical protein